MDKISPLLKKYIIYCCFIAAGMLVANHFGVYPTFGIFSGTNSMHSGSSGGGGFHGGYGIHGK